MSKKRLEGGGECIVGGVGGGSEELAVLMVLILEDDESENSDSGWDNRDGFPENSSAEADEDLLRFVEVEGGEREVDAARSSLSSAIEQAPFTWPSLI